MSNKDKQVSRSEDDLQNTDLDENQYEPDGDDADHEEVLDEQIQNLRDENKALLDKFVRAKAETENTRRISAKEVDKARKFALESFTKELLSVKDSLDQAVQVDLQDGASQKLIEQMSEGLSLTLKQLENVFDRFHVEKVHPEAGDKLDPEYHQAMTRQPSDEVDANNVLATLQTGYTLNGRLLRPAMVIVSSGSE